VLDFARPADAVLSAFFREQRALGARDRAFVAEAVFGVLRRYRYLSAVVPAVNARTLLVAWLIKARGLAAGALADVAKPDLLQHIREADTASLPPGVQADLPDWVVERLPLDEAAMLSLGRALQQPAPLDLRVNTLKTDRDAVLAQLAADGIDAAPTPYSPWGVRVKGHPAINRHPLFEAGAVEVQDEGSQLLALLVGARRGEMVCDFCAGAGGKTLALGASMASTGRLYAFDVAEKRLSNLKPRMARSGLSNVTPQLIANENDARVKRLAGKFDRVLVDAPCSGLGTLRRNPDLKFRQSPEGVAELTAKQASILASAARLVKPGGRLVYATCSLLPEENDAVVAGLLAGGGWSVVPASDLLAQHKIALEPALADDYLRLSPALHDTDGFFAAVLAREPA